MYIYNSRNFLKSRIDSRVMTLGIIAGDDYQGAHKALS